MIALTREPSGRRASTIGELFVAAPPERSDDAIDDALDVVFAVEFDVGLVEESASLDVDLVGTVNHDLGDRLVMQQRIDRSI